MDWKERVSHYASDGVSGSMVDEDHAASRIVAGLCGNGSKVHLLAKRLGVLDQDSTEIELAKAILDSVSGGMFHHSSPARRFILDVRKPNRKKTVWNDDAELAELCELASTVPDGMIVVSRVASKDKVTSYSFVFLKDVPEPKDYVMRPVSVLLAKCNGMAVWRRETKQLFKDMAECMKWDVPEEYHEE